MRVDFHSFRTISLGSALVLASVALPSLAEDAPVTPLYPADYSAVMSGPTSLFSGVSGTYNLTVFNSGGSDSLELIIIFQGETDQTDQVIAPGWDCELREDAGINAAIRCVMAQVNPTPTPGEGYGITFQARGLNIGEGRIDAVLNPSRIVYETDYENNNSGVKIVVK